MPFSVHPTDTSSPQEKQDKAVLQSEVASLRQNNQRLQEVAGRQRAAAQS